MNCCFIKLVANTTIIYLGKMKQSNLTSLLGPIAITIFGIVQGEVTVFYIVYLFWFQEFIRTIIDMVYLRSKQRINLSEKITFLNFLGSFFLLFIYFVFIVVLFCFITNWAQKGLLIKNFNILAFRNIYFNCSLVFFALSFLYQRWNSENNTIITSAFNPRHIILHISIILGGMIQFMIVKKYNIDSLWGSVAIIAPFLLLKLFFELRYAEESPASLS